ncbi:unnamed protein product [Symbiodinium natans]|uniref:Uncharacterized protein n=1 Tax=Symbiodinium natans TaxID=878477 RepID=A0A812LJC9_9DINO|nr:unnamed protein product [Symbiodinium natans]
MAIPHGSVHADISHEKGMGEETMMAFIHKHLNSILQPFADSVDELNGVVSQMAETFSGHERQLQDHSQTLKVMKADLKATKMSMLEVRENQQKQFADVDSQLTAAKKDAQKVKDDVFQLDRRHRESHSMMLDVKRINGAADLEVRRLAGELAKLDDMVAKQVNIVLDPVRAEVARAAQGQCRTEESCRKSEERVQQQREELDTFLENHGRQRRQEELRIKAILKTIADLDHKLGQTNANLKQHVASAKGTSEELSILTRRHEQTMRMQVVQERQQQESNERQAVFTNRLEGLKADIQNVMESLGLTEGAANLVLTVERLKEASATHSASLNELHDLCNTQGESICALQQRADALQQADVVLQQEDMRLEASLGKRIQELHEDLQGFCQNEERDRDELKKETEIRARQHEDCMTRIRCHEEEIGRLSSQLKPLEAGLEMYKAKVQVLEGAGWRAEWNYGPDTGRLRLKHDRQRVFQKLASKEYWKGLTRGTYAVKDAALCKCRGHASLKAGPRPVKPKASEDPWLSLQKLENEGSQGRSVVLEADAFLSSFAAQAAAATPSPVQLPATSPKAAQSKRIRDVRSWQPQVPRFDSSRLSEEAANLEKSPVRRLRHIPFRTSAEDEADGKLADVRAWRPSLVRCDSSTLEEPHRDGQAEAADQSQPRILRDSAEAGSEADLRGSPEALSAPLPPASTPEAHEVSDALPAPSPPAG